MNVRGVAQRKLTTSLVFGEENTSVTGGEFRAALGIGALAGGAGGFIYDHIRH